MIIYKCWTETKQGRGHLAWCDLVRQYEGWFLFGFLPLYIRQVSERRIPR